MTILRRLPKLARIRRYTTKDSYVKPTGSINLPSSVRPPPEPVDIPTSLWYRRLGPVTDFFGWFHKTQGRRPLTTQLVTTAITYLTGDLLAQDIGGEPYDPKRTLRMFTIGVVASIPGYKW